MELPSLSTGNRLDDLVPTAATIFSVLFVLLPVVSVVADLIIAFVIIRYRKLRSEKINLIVLHFTVLDSLLILIPIIATFVDLYSPRPIGYTTFRILVIVESVLYVAITFNMALLTLCWYVKLHHPCFNMTLSRKVKTVLISIYVLLALVIVSLVYISDRVFGIFILEILFVITVIALYISFMLVINIVHFIKKGRLTDYKMGKDYQYFLSNVFLLSKIPLLAVFAGLLTDNFRDIDSFIPLLCTRIAALMAIINGIYFFIILFSCNDDYRTCLKHTLTCKCTNINYETLEQPIKYTEALNPKKDGKVLLF